MRMKLFSHNYNPDVDCYSISTQTPTEGRVVLPEEELVLCGMTLRGNANKDISRGECENTLTHFPVRGERGWHTGSGWYSPPLPSQPCGDHPGQRWQGGGQGRGMVLLAQTPCSRHRMWQPGEPSKQSHTNPAAAWARQPKPQADLPPGHTQLLPHGDNILLLLFPDSSAEQENSIWSPTSSSSGFLGVSPFLTGACSFSAAQGHPASSRKGSEQQRMQELEPPGVPSEQQQQKREPFYKHSPVWQIQWYNF